MIRTFRPLRLPIGPRGFFAALVAVLILLTSCSSDTDPDEEPELRHIALVAPVHAEEQGDAIRLGAEAAAKENGLALDYVSLEPSDDEAEQLQAALKMLEKGASAILIDPASEAVLQELGDKAAAAGTPVIALNDERMTTGILSAIVINNEAAGRKAGEQLADLLEGRGTVAILRSDMEDPDLIAREEGAKRVWSDIGGIEIAGGAACGKREDACWQAAKQLLDQGAVDGILALDIQASLGAAKEVARRKVQGEIKIVTFGSDLGQLQLLQDGVLHKLVVQNGFSTGYLGVEQAVKVMDGSRYDKPIVLETKVIDADNMFWMDNQKVLFPFVK
ncbi:substrate-binding domain-containing protein [Paenibacillus sp. FSL H8-0457]|uniref:substrate-binding domain-containing protein n=1 Tax=unclassified Paenibacillus TaxID=185978 RepID=UPI0003E1C857|nr:substrate-binding domain-containing protein [Paenibacillus sp. FSL H8-457]ETT67183.1 periplasmic-binding protein/LacI transcriptional regulator [Paenibacillus sp. FSL H8-457]